MTKRRLFGIFLAATSAVLILLILTDWAPLLRGPAPGTDVWYWRYAWQGFERAAPMALLSVLFLMFSFWWLREKPGSRWRTVVGLIGVFCLVVALQAALLFADRGAPVAELVERTLAVNSNGYFTTALAIDDLNATLRAYPDLMPQFESEHARTHPPGLVVLNWLVWRGMSQSEGTASWVAGWIRPNRCGDIWLYQQPDSVPAALGVMALLPVLAAGLCVFPAYGVARQVRNAATPGIARLATLFVALLPALLLFVPLPDQLFALLTLLIVFSLHEGIGRESGGWFLFSGILLSLSTMLSIGNVMLGIVVVVYAVTSWWLLGKPWTWRIARWAAAFAAGAASLWLLLWAGWGVAPWEIVLTGLDQHYALVTQFRSYGVWLGYNWIDLLLFAGLPVCVGFGGAVVAATRDVRRRSAETAHQTALALALLLFLVILTLSGGSRGEVGRLWLFFMPLLAILAGIWLGGVWRSTLPRVGVVALQLGFVLALGLAWQQVDAVIVQATPPEAPAAQPQTVLDAQFEEGIVLVGVDGPVSAESGAALDLTLQWKADRPTSYPYTVFVHLVDADGNLLAQSDSIPVGGTWPSTCWEPGALVADAHRVPLPPELPPGTALRVGLYHGVTGDRLRVNGSEFVVIEGVSTTAPADR